MCFISVLYKTDVCHAAVILSNSKIAKVIWEEAASPLLLANPLITNAQNRSTVIARSVKRL